MSYSKFLSATSFSFLIIWAAGCGGSGATVTGKVTFNGKPVESGYITFYPEDSKHAAVGGEIKNGSYRVKNVPPGKNRVDVSSNPKSSLTPTTSEDTAKVKNVGRHADQIAPTDEGNGKMHEISSGGTELNLRHQDQRQFGRQAVIGADHSTSTESSP